MAVEVSVTTFLQEQERVTVFADQTTFRFLNLHVVFCYLFALAVTSIQSVECSFLVQSRVVIIQYQLNCFY